MALGFGEIMENTSFEEDLKFGLRYEPFAQELLAKKGIMTTRMEGQGDYDLITNKGKKIDVKTSRLDWITGKVCLELWTNHRLKIKGWLQKDIDAIVWISVGEDGEVYEVVLYNLRAIQDILLKYWFKGGTWEGSHSLQVANAKYSGHLFVENVLIPKSWLYMTNPVTLFRK